MLGGGCGDQMAKWIVNGRPEFDMFGYDIRRYYAPLNKNMSWVTARSHEAYAKNYYIVFPHDEPLAGRNVRKSPLHKVRICSNELYCCSIVQSVIQCRNKSVFIPVFVSKNLINI